MYEGTAACIRRGRGPTLRYERQQGQLDSDLGRNACDFAVQPLNLGDLFMECGELGGLGPSARPKASRRLRPAPLWLQEY